MLNIFDNISVKNKNKLLRELRADTYTYQKNTKILQMISNDNIIGIINKGYIQIIKNDYNANKTVLEELYDNDIFATSFSSIKNKENEIITKEDTEITIIDYNTIINFNDNKKQYYNQFIKNLFQITIEKIEEKNDRIEILSNKTIRNKLLEYFKITSKKHGSRNIYLPTTFTDLADYLSIDRSAMTRELKYLKEEGFIEIKGKRITLLYR